METKNIFRDLPGSLKEEAFEPLVESESVLIERIVSKGHKSPEHGWYDQDRNEWVMVLQGEARLLFENDETVHLEPGRYVNIPAHTRHKVLWTTDEMETIWLAVHYP